MAREMKDSGVPWIGVIPTNWSKKRFKYAGTLQKGKLPTTTNVDGVGMPIMGASEMLGKPPRQYSIETDLPLCSKDDVLILWDGANAGIVASGLNGIVSSTAAVYSSRYDESNNRFIYYLFKSSEPYFRDKVFGTTIPHMNTSYIDDIPMLTPPLPEQQAIADFLDKKCSEIDELVVLQEKMIEELKAYKQSVITEAVTKGLDPNVPMKDSGIDWIGEIPEGWEVIRIKYLLEERKERSIFGQEEPLSMSQKYGLIPTKDMDNIPNMASSFIGAKLAFKEDLVFNKLKAHLGVFSVSKYDGLVSPDYAVYYSKGNVSVKYLEYLFKTPTYINEFKKLSSGVGAGLTRLYTSDLYSIYCIFPPLDEQQSMIKHIDTNCSMIDSLIKIKQDKIEALKEYKKSIIYEYVTGKKEVV